MILYKKNCLFAKYFMFIFDCKYIIKFKVNTFTQGIIFTSGSRKEPGNRYIIVGDIKMTITSFERSNKRGDFESSSSNTTKSLHVSFQKSKYTCCKEWEEKKEEQGYRQATQPIFYARITQACV